MANEPLYKDGRICYKEIQDNDVEASAHSYRHSFGWNVMKWGDGATAFDDTVGQ